MPKSNRQPANPQPAALALIIDDEPDLLALLSISLGRMGIKSVKAGDLQTARRQLAQRPFDLCLTDLRLPDGSGMEIVRHVQAHHPDTPIAVITAYGDLKTAVEALQHGAFDYVAKPVEVAQLQSMVQTALRLKQTGDSPAPTTLLLGQSAVMRATRALISKVARNQAPVHIHGETGTGKELIARLIHENSPRKTGAFVAVNCGAIPRELMESEFFGHKKGSFTGAYSDKQGLFESASDGTLFLDEVAELPPELQVKLLRAIQEKRVRPVGAVAENPINLRLISATQKNLTQMVEQGQFRQDLYYRINVIPIAAPSLRERREDVPELVRHFIDRISRNNGLPPPDISAPALHALCRHAWPGNVRELENIIERTLVLHDRECARIEVADIRLPESRAAADTLAELAVPMDAHLNRIETGLIRQALAETGGNITDAARLLGTTFRSLRYKMKKLGLRD